MELFVITPGAILKQRDGIFRLMAGEVKKDISPSRLSRIVLSPSSAVTGAAVMLAQEHNIDLVLLDKYGDPAGRFWHSRLGRVAVVRRRQLEGSAGHLGFGIATGLVLGKLQNQAAFIKQLAQKREHLKHDLWSSAERILEIRQRIESIDRDSPLQDQRSVIMGYEGSAGRDYFQCLSKVMPSNFRFPGRSRRPARDPFNAVLNYCYGILYSQVEHACILAGLDPFVGFLHADSYGQTSLVFDLIEPFRIHGERVSVFLFTGRKMKEDFFDRSEGAVTLNEQGKPVVVNAMNEYLEKKIRYRRRNLRRFNVIRQEAHRIAALLERNEYEPEIVVIEEF